MPGTRKCFALLTCAAAATITVGCDMATSVAVQVPAILQSILNDSGSFTADNAELSDIETGTVVDDAATIDGCWGNFRTTVAAADSTEAQAFGDSEIQEVTAFAFDAGTGELSVYVLLQNMDGSTGLVNVVSGSYALSDNNTITQDVTEAGITDPRTGELVTSDVEGSAPITNEWLVTLRDDELKVLRVAADGAVNQDDALILRRFDCP